MKRPQFGLRSLLLFIAFCSVLSAVFAWKHQESRNAHYKYLESLQNELFEAKQRRDFWEDSPDPKADSEVKAIEKQLEEERKR